MPEQNYAVATVPLLTSGDRWASGKLLGNALDSCAGSGCSSSGDSGAAISWSLILKRKKMPEQNYAVATVPLLTSGDRWASGKLLGNALDSCAGTTQGRLASSHWHSLPWGWKRAYSASGAAAHGCWLAFAGSHNSRWDRRWTSSLTASELVYGLRL